jgi:hypothetical protein
MKAKVIMDGVEWEVYKNSFPLSRESHVPAIPPSFPVLVISNIVSNVAWHQFIETNDLRRLLGLPDKT